jgi:hypothetical protein
MDMNTTNINELPIDTNPPDNRDLPEQQINSSMSRMIDPSIKIDDGPKRVRFQENPIINKSKRFELKDTHKVIILSMIIFLLFSDNKVKNYIMNILEVIFGKFLKSTTGTNTKIGLVFYSIVFGLSLFLCITFIDISSIKMAL